MPSVCSVCFWESGSRGQKLYDTFFASMQWRITLYSLTLYLQCKHLRVKRYDNPVIVFLLEKLSWVCTETEVMFCWLPSHKGIQGNEKADPAANSFLPYIYTDFKPFVCGQSPCFLGVMIWKGRVQLKL